MSLLSLMKQVVDLTGNFTVDVEKMSQDAQKYCRDVKQRLKCIYGLLDDYMEIEPPRSKSTQKTADGMIREMSGMAIDTSTNMNRMASVLSVLDRLQVVWTEIDKQIEITRTSLSSIQTYVFAVIEKDKTKTTLATDFSVVALVLMSCSSIPAQYIQALTSLTDVVSRLRDTTTELLHDLREQSSGLQETLKRCKQSTAHFGSFITQIERVPLSKVDPTWRFIIDDMSTCLDKWREHCYGLVECCKQQQLQSEKSVQPSTTTTTTIVEWTVSKKSEHKQTEDDLKNRALENFNMALRSYKSVSEPNLVATREYLQKAIDTQQDCVASMSARAILENKQIHWMQCIMPTAWFVGPFHVSRDAQGRTYIHCRYELAKDKVLDVSLVAVQDPNPDSMADHFRNCGLVKNGKGPLGIAIEPEVMTQKGKYRIGFVVVFLKAQLLVDEANRLILNRSDAAFKLFCQAAQLGNAEAEIQMAEMLLEGRGTDVDPMAALTLFRKIAAHSVYGTFRLGQMLLDPRTQDNDPTEAARLLQVAADAGHAEAAFLLGRMCLEGRGVDVDMPKVREYLGRAARSTDITTSKATKIQASLLLASTHDRNGDHKAAYDVLTDMVKQHHSSHAQLLLCFRTLVGIGMASEPFSADGWIKQAAQDKVRPIDMDPAVLLSKELISSNFLGVAKERLETLFCAGNDFEGPVTMGNDSAGRRTIECSMIHHVHRTKSRVMLVSVDPKLEDVKRYVTECISGSVEDPAAQPLGMTLHVDILDPECGFREVIPFGLIMPAPVEEKFAETTTVQEKKEEQQCIVITRSGHHTNNWLAVMGDVDRIMPTLLKYLNRDWKRDIAERNSGLEWLPQRLHLSLGKPTFGDVYIGKIGVGCSCWIYVILSTPPPTLRPEIHTTFPVIVAKARKFYLRVSQVLEWHNRIEATILCHFDYTTDDECQQAMGLATDTKSTSESSMTKESKSKTAMETDSDAMSLELPSQPLPSVSAFSKTEQKIPVFAIDFVSRRNIWEGKGPLEVFLSGIASYMIRNPQESLRIPRRHQYSGFADPSFRGGLNYDDDDEEKKDIHPHSVVGDLAGPHGKTFPWSSIQHFRGIMPNEGPRKENRVCYVQGICMKTVQLPGVIWGKVAYMVTIRVDEERYIDLDVWCLGRHMIDGRATIVANEYPSYNLGSIPVQGDLVFTDVWIHGTIATGLQPMETIGTVVTTSTATLATSTTRGSAMDQSVDTL